MKSGGVYHLWKTFVTFLLDIWHTFGYIFEFGFPLSGLRAVCPFTFDLHTAAPRWVLSLFGTLEMVLPMKIAVGQQFVKHADRPGSSPLFCPHSDDCVERLVAMCLNASNDCDVIG